MGHTSIGTKLYRDTLQDSSGESWEEISELNSVGFPDKSREMVDLTHLNSPSQYRVFKSGFRTGGTVRFNINFTATQYGKLNADYHNDNSVFYKVVLGDSAASEFVFEGLISSLGGTVPEGSGKITNDVEIQVTGTLETEPT